MVIPFFSLFVIFFTPIALFMIMIRKRATGMKKMTKREKKGIIIRGKEPEYGNAITIAKEDIGRVPIKEDSRMVYGYAQMALGVLL